MTRKGKGDKPQDLSTATGRAATPQNRIATLCRETRMARAMTIASLSDRAHVSNRSITIIENGRLQKELTQGRDRQRKMRAWTFVLMKLALALEQDPDLWIQEADIRLPEAELKKIKNKARRRTAPSGRLESDTLGKIRLELRSNPDDTVPIDVHLLTSDESTHGQRSFYERLVKLLLRTINPRLRPRPSAGATTFEEVMDGLSGSPPRHALVCGAFQMVGRSHHRIIFIPIPGWRVRLGALALPGAGITWEHIRQSGKGLPPRVQSELHILTIEREAGDVYLRSFCEFPAAQVSRIQKYQVQDAAAAYHRELKKNKKAVLVIGEYEASVVRKILRDQHGYELADVAAESEAAPRYQLALATAEGDERWAKTLSNAIDELFKNAGAMMAELYGQYMTDVINEAILAEESRGREKREVLRHILGLDRPRPDDTGSSRRRGRGGRTVSRSISRVPSYLQLHEIEFPVSNAFRHRLHDFLKWKLQEAELCDPGEPFAPYLASLAPQLRSDDQKILSSVRQMRRELERLRGEQAAQRALLERLSSLLGRQ